VQPVSFREVGFEGGYGLVGMRFGFPIFNGLAQEHSDLGEDLHSFADVMDIRDGFTPFNCKRAASVGVGEHCDDADVGVPSCLEFLLVVCQGYVVNGAIRSQSLEMLASISLRDASANPWVS
jgi:hypothetical protein